MKFLVTGGCGNMGGHVIRSLVEKGHSVRVVDIDENVKKLEGPNVEAVRGNISNQAIVNKVMEGIEAVIHLAWSFKSEFTELLDIDVKGYYYILEAATANNVKAVINTTTAVSYGKPMKNPVDENHPHLVEFSRSPFYGLAKLATEELTKIYAAKNPAMIVNDVMVWYAYGETIGGRNLRQMAKDAMTTGVIEVPAGSGGNFLHLDDYVSAVLAIIQNQPSGELFNLGTAYLTWEEVAKLIIAHANPKATVRAVPRREWQGSDFLADDWPISTKKAENFLKYKTNITREKAVEALSNALKLSVDKAKKELGK